MSEGLARRKTLRAFGRGLGLKATAADDCALLDAALTHDSYAFEHGAKRGASAGERLEWLGDAVVGLAVSNWLYAHHPSDPEGRLSRRRQALVSGAALAQTAQRLGFASVLRLGKGEASARGAARPSILAGAFEAVVGAAFVAEGYQAAAKLVERVHLAHVKSASLHDPRTQLQELAQARFKKAPTYTSEGESGPPHARVFLARVRVGEVVGTGSGPTKKQSQAAAAADALRKLTRQTVNLP